MRGVRKSAIRRVRTVARQLSAWRDGADVCVTISGVEALPGWKAQRHTTFPRRYTVWCDGKCIFDGDRPGAYRALVDHWLPEASSI